MRPNDVVWTYPNNHLVSLKATSAMKYLLAQNTILPFSVATRKQLYSGGSQEDVLLIATETATLQLPIDMLPVLAKTGFFRSDIKVTIWLVKQGKDEHQQISLVRLFPGIG